MTDDIDLSNAFDTAGLPLLLGEAPSKSGDEFYKVPLSGAVGVRLAKWSGVVPEDLPASDYSGHYLPLRKAFECRNLIKRYPGAQGRGASFPRDLARPAWEELLPTLDDRTVVLLGSRLFFLTGLATPGGGALFFRWFTPNWCARVAAIPHPSGLNGMYADKAHVRSASRILHEARAVPV